MATKTQLFISWSGELSKQFGQAVGEWLQDALQFIEPFFTPDQVEKGAKWLPEISGKLEACDCAIICLTRENLSNPWILFEAGALAKKANSRVCTLLFDVAKADVEFPLAMFQATDFAKEDFRGLVETINNVGGDLSLKESGLARVFDKWWPELEEKVNRIRAEYKPTDKSTRRPVPEMVAEILELVRSSTRERENEVASRVRAEYDERFHEGLLKKQQLMKRITAEMHDIKERALAECAQKTQERIAC